MKASELQIGDYVNYRGQIIKVTSLYDKGGSNEVGWSDKESVWVNADNVEPIPLTPEILEHNFERKGRNYAFSTDFYEVEIHEYNDGMYMLTHTSCEMDLPSTQIANICFVHQLQHALRLCGIDKELKL